MKRSYINTLYFSFVMCIAPISIYYLITLSLSWWMIAVIPICIIIIKRQDTIYQADQQYYFRRVPFSKGIALKEINVIAQLRHLDSESNLTDLWKYIKKLNNENSTASRH